MGVSVSRVFFYGRTEQTEPSGISIEVAPNLTEVSGTGIVLTPQNLTERFGAYPTGCILENLEGLILKYRTII